MSVAASVSASGGQESERIAVGRVVAPWGLRGDVRVEFLTTNAERFRQGGEVWLRGAPRRIESSRTQKNQVILKLSGVDRVEDAETLRGEFLEVPVESVPTLPAEWYYHYQLLGLEVWMEDGRHLGMLAEILETGANDVYIVRGTGRDYLIPAVADVVQQVDLEAGRLLVRDMPGLLD